MARSEVSRFAQALVRPDLPAFIPRTKYPTFHQGWITGPDNGRAVTGFQFAELGSNSRPMPEVVVMQSYTAADMPRDGEVAWLQQFDGRVTVVARHYRPDGFVIVP